MFSEAYRKQERGKMDKRRSLSKQFRRKVGRSDISHDSEAINHSQQHK
jgi:hypothetical protein